MSEKTSPSVWCWRSSCQDWTTATQCWQAFPHRHSSHFKESSTLPHGSSATFHITNTSLPICASCTGFRFAQKLNTCCAWRCAVYTVVAALRTSPTCCSRQLLHHVHFVCAPPTRQVTSSRDFRQNSENGRFHILVQRHGINFQSTPNNCRLSLFSSENLKQSCSHVV